jgi:hypothetical protein
MYKKLKKKNLNSSASQLRLRSEFRVKDCIIDLPCISLAYVDFALYKKLDFFYSIFKFSPTHFNVEFNQYHFKRDGFFVGAICDDRHEYQYS